MNWLQIVFFSLCATLGVSVGMHLFDSFEWVYMLMLFAVSLLASVFVAFITKPRKLPNN